MGLKVKISIFQLVQGVLEIFRYYFIAYKGKERHYIVNL